MPVFFAVMMARRKLNSQAGLGSASNSLRLAFDLFDFAIGSVDLTLKAGFVAFVFANEIHRPKSTTETGGEQ
jgi:hypothetical protein